MPSNAYKHVKYLVEECGVRVAGTENAMKASEYVATQLSQMDLHVEKHVFKTPICTVKNSELKFKVGDKWMDIPHLPALFSAETPEEGLTLSLVYLENGNLGMLKKKDVKGKAVLISRDVYEDYPDVETYKLLHQYGVAMVIYTTSDGHKDVPYVYANYETMNEDYTIPTAIINYYDALELARNETGEICYSASFSISEGDSMSVVGTLDGDGTTDESIIICGHIDSATGSVGATDDAGAIGIILALAEYYAKNKIRNKRAIKFIGWSGHECGLHGSKAYLLSHPEVLANTKFVLNYDVIGNAVSNYMVAGGFNEKVEKELASILDELENGWPLAVAPLVCDTLNFAANEIQQITLTGGCFAGNHTKYDNFDLISEYGLSTPIEFSKKVIQWAATAQEIPQGYSEEVNRMMKATGNRYNWGLFEK